MRSPFTARSTLDAVLSERDRLREQNDRLMETVLRLARKEKGLPEIQPEKRADPILIPAEVTRMINAFESPHIRAMRERNAMACFRQTKDWNAVMELLALPEEETA